MQVELIVGLKNKDSEVRDSSASQLAEILEYDELEPDEVLEYQTVILEAALLEADESVQETMFEAFATGMVHQDFNASELNWEPLLGRLEELPGESLAFALAALGAANDEWFRIEIEKFLDDERDFVREAAHDALSALNEND